MTQTVRPRWHFRTLAARIAAAVGHAMVFWLFAELLGLIIEDAGIFGQSSIVLISGLTAWLLCVRGAHCVRLWQFALAGYLAVALDVMIAMGIVTTTMMGRFDMVMTATSLAAVLPWVLAPWGTLMAVVSTIYGMLLCRLVSLDAAQRAVHSGRAPPNLKD